MRWPKVSSPRSSATGRSSRCCAIRTITEIMVNGPDQVYVERSGKLDQTDVALRRRRARARASSTASSRRSAGASTSRRPMVDARLPDGSRVNAIIPPLALDGPDDHHPQVLQGRRSRVDDLIRFGTLTPEMADFLDACVRGAAEHRRLRRHRLRQDDAAERAVGLHPGRRAHRHHRGRRRAAAAAGPRGRARGAPAEHRGQGRGHASATW